MVGGCVCVVLAIDYDSNEMHLDVDCTQTRSFTMNEIEFSSIYQGLTHTHDSTHSIVENVVSFNLIVHRMHIAHCTWHGRQQ